MPGQCEQGGNDILPHAVLKRKFPAKCFKYLEIQHEYHVAIFDWFTLDTW